jgi:hypothetical protein
MNEEPTPPMRPQDQTVFLLGQLSGQFTAFQQSIEARDTTQAEVNGTFRAGIERAQSTADQAMSHSQITASRIPAKTPWHQYASGYAAIGAIVLAGIALLRVVFP